MTFQDLKQKGNDHFTRQDYEGAITFYTKALELSPAEHTVYSNRSVALCKLGRYGEALKDATRCIDLAPTFARGHLRKCAALNELGRHEEALESAQEGYKLRGSDNISRSCVAQWLVAVQALLKEKIERIQKEIQFVFPKQLLVISDDYLTLVLNLLLARLNNSTTGVPVEAMVAYLFKTLQELDRVLKLFGHSPSPCGEEWVSALWHASKLDPSSSKVPPKAVALVLSKSEQLATWLLEEVDHLLYPVICPIVSLAMMAVSVRFISLNCLAVDQHVVEVTCRACLPFFEKSLLSPPKYAEQHIAIYKELLEAMATSSCNLSRDEVQFIEESIARLQLLLDKTPDCERDIFEKAMVSIGLVQNRLGQNPDFDHIPYGSDHGKAVSRQSIEKVLSFVEAKEEALKFVLQLPLKESLPEYAVVDSQSLLSCTGALLRAGQSSRAAEIYNLGESIFRRILQRQILSKSFSLDAAPKALNLLQTMVLTSAKSFLGVNNSLLADAIIRWKCIFSEFRAILMQLGVGAKYLETFKALQEMKTGKGVSSANMEDRLIRISEEHQRAVHQVMCVKGMLLLVSLLKQNHEEVRSLLKPGQILLEYCPGQNEYSYSKLTGSGPVEDEYNGLLLVLQTGKAPVIKSIDFAEAAACARKWIKAAPKCSRDEALQLTSELCDLLIPAEIQVILSSDHIQQVLLCPDPTFTLVPLDLLPLPGGQKLGDKCTMVYLSAARELLRSSALTATQEIFSVIKEHGKSIQEDGSTQATAREPAGIAARIAQPEPVLVPSAKECLIFADPNYDLEQRCPAEGDAGVLQTLIAGLSSLFLKPSQQTSIACPLPKTRDEAHEIEYTLSVAEKSLVTRCFLGDDATLSSALQVESPFMLHFSTHGFSKASVLGVPGTFWDDTKCGLILAGANTYRRGDLSRVTAVAGTGELTALAVMGMNLHGTRLVYLSACISAQGSVASGESVNSLAQAFRAAGAQTVVATLWSVLDNEARMFAVHFYHEVCKTGVTPSRALLSAKRKMQEDGYHWIFWSGFICIGEDTPLFQDV